MTECPHHGLYNVDSFFVIAFEQLWLSMPRIKTSRSKRPPAGFEDIQDVLEDFAQKMKDGVSLYLPCSYIVENIPHEGKSTQSSLAPIFQIYHQRSRYIYDLYYNRETISKELYDWLLKQSYADGNLIAKWKKPGYEKLCCLRCIQTKETNFNTTCICRVPRATLAKDQIDSECVHCGCRGCSSGKILQIIRLTCRRLSISFDFKAASGCNTLLNAQLRGFDR